MVVSVEPVDPVSPFWIAAVAALVLLAVAAAFLTHRLAAEIRASKALMDDFVEAALAVREDVVRTRAAIDDLSSLQHFGAEQALGAVFKWAASAGVPTAVAPLAEGAVELLLRKVLPRVL